LRLLRINTSRFFDALEVQQTFYDEVSESTLRNWRSKAPETLEFTVKALQVITHPASSPTYKRMKRFEGNRENFGFFRQNEDVMRALETTLSEAKLLGAKVIVFQTPESFRPTEENLRNLREFARSSIGALLTRGSRGGRSGTPIKVLRTSSTS